MPAKIDPASLNLKQWLDLIQSLHPVEIDMGLHRVGQVAGRLGLLAGNKATEAPVDGKKIAPLIITIAGTNGKGSCVAMLQSILRSAGYRVGTYTSPHILRYNERVQIEGTDADDTLFCKAFSDIWQAQQGVSLSYFEYSTLAALLMLQQADLDVIVLEVGLGGRLDAVNLIDPDIAVITSIGLDHQEWLGDTRELIGREKAGIFRAGIPAVCGDIDLPESISAYAAKISCDIYQQGVHYGFVETLSSSTDEVNAPLFWSWWGQSNLAQPMQFSELPLPALDLLNAATVLQVVALLAEQIPFKAIASGLAGLVLPGRFQTLHDPGHKVPVIVDVAHNPHAAQLLMAKLSRLKNRLAEHGGRIHLILAMMRDKDQQGFFLTLESIIDIWYIAHFEQPRCLPAPELLRVLQNASQQKAVIGSQKTQLLGPFETLSLAYEEAVKASEEGDVIVATGSFFTVAALMQMINDSNLHHRSH